MASATGATLTKHLLEQQAIHKGSGELSTLLSSITTAAKIISRDVTKAGLAELLGLTGKKNVQGERVMKLDEYANSIMKDYLGHSADLCAIASEEDEDFTQTPDYFPKGKYVLSMDPLDGSSNIDANVSIGTIFSIHRKVSPGVDGRIDDFLQEGRKQVAAGYVLYGSSTMLVYTTGSGVWGFTLDSGIGEFLLSHPNLVTPRRGKIFSANMGNFYQWTDDYRNYVRYLLENDKDTGRPYSSRYIGSLVADFHRNMLYGGIFLYPPDPRSPKGKLRLLYEAAPLAFIIENAGGTASTGNERILDIKPTELHQRVPLIIGSLEDVEKLEEFVREG